jgi:hypothetical protein
VEKCIQEKWNMTYRKQKEQNKQKNAKKKQTVKNGDEEEKPTKPKLELKVHRTWQ